MGIEQGIKDFLRFLLKPVSQPISGPLDVPTMISLFLILFVVELFLFFPIAAILGLNDIPHAMTDLIDTMQLWKVMLMAVILAPIMEEMLFRFHLRYRSLTAVFLFGSAIFLGWLLCSINGVAPDLLALNLSYIQYAIVGIVLILFLFIIYRKRVGYFSDFGLVFYTTALVFAFAHVTNFEVPDGKEIFAPLMVLPQLLLALYLGYIRLKRGIFSAMFLHAFNNAIPFALILMTDLGMNQ